MSIDLPPIDTLRHVADRLKANDIAWFREKWKAGEFSWLKGRLPDGEYDRIGSRIEAGDLGPLRERLSGLNLPGVGSLFSGLGNITGNVTGKVSGAAAGGAAKVAGGVGAAGAGAAAIVNNNKKKGGIWLLLPLLAIAGLLAVLLTQCGNDDDAPATETTISVTETTLPAVTETTPAETTPATEPAAAAPANVIALAEGAGNFGTLVAAINAAGLTETLQGAGPFTVFAPTDEAFAKLPAGAVDALLKPENKATLESILKYHVVSGAVKAADVKTGDVPSIEGSNLAVVAEGGTVKIGDATVTTADLESGNGIVHVIDTVLIPPTVDVAALLAAPAADTTVAVEAAATDTTVAAAPAAAGDIIETATAAGSFNTLATALGAAGLVDTLKGPGPFTVFAPTDEAFAKVPAETLAALLKPENKAILEKVLTYHVVAGKVMAADIKAGDVATVEGQSIKVTVDGSTVKVNDATVVTADVEASNGVIHVIDAVLVPSDVDLSKLNVEAAAEEVVSVGAPEDLTIYFASGSANINAEGKAKIEAAVTTLKSLPAGTKVNVLGHADKNGNAAANQALSERRANAVKAALEKGLGADAGNISFEVGAVGDTQPSEDLAKSRKVTIEIAK
jgi:transforming growth factor-beta-induced protein